MEEKVVGRVTSAVFSPQTNSNIGLAIIKRRYNDIGTSLLASNEKVQTNVWVEAMPVKGGSAAPSSASPARTDGEGRGEAALLA